MPVAGLRADRFQAMVRYRHAEALAVWLRADRSAVAAALALPWSNGQTEGQITELKLLKRQMYGRAKLDLLRARIFGAA